MALSDFAQAESKTRKNATEVKFRIMASLEAKRREKSNV